MLPMFWNSFVVSTTAVLKCCLHSIPPAFGKDSMSFYSYLIHHCARLKEMLDQYLPILEDIFTELVIFPGEQWLNREIIEFIEPSTVSLLSDTVFTCTYACRELIQGGLEHQEHADYVHTYDSRHIGPPIMQ